MEAYLDDVHRWVPFDPTPWRAREHALGLDARAGLLGDAVAAVRSALLRAWLRLRNDPSTVLADALLHPATWVSAAALAAWWWRSRRASRDPSAAAREAREAPADLRRLHARWLAALRRRAAPPPAPSETDEEYVERLAREAPALGPPARAFLAAWQRLRFGGDEGARQAVLDGLRDLESAGTPARARAEG